MRSFTTTIVLALAALCFASTTSAQQAATTAVPNLIRYGATLKDAGGAPITAATGVTFAIYKQQDGGAAVWMETQNVTPDANGQYSVLLGSTTATGLPSDLFSQEEQRWLGVQVEGQVEQPRVLMVSVPYAFKAHEAETLGGKSVSDFVLANGANSSGGQAIVASSGQAASSDSLQPGQKGAGSLPLQDGPTNFSGSNTTQIVGVTQSGTGAGLSASAASNAVVGTATASSGTAGVFNNTAGGKILSGRSGGTEEFSVDGSGNVNAASGYQIAGSSVLGVARTSLFVGIGAGFHTTGTADVFCGYQAGFTTTTGSTNTFSGFKAGYSNTTGSSNSFYGAQAGYSGVTGSYNTFAGELAGYSNVGSYNTFAGFGAGYSNTTGSYNILYGENAGHDNTTGSSDVYIANPGSTSGTESNTIRIGDQGSGTGHQNAAYMAGIYGSTTTNGTAVFIDSSGKLGTGGSGTALVTSFNGRTGAVLPAASDYSFSLISGTLGATQLRGTYTDRVTLNNADNSFTGNGAGLTGVLPAGGSPRYIQNGTAQQSSANFNISGDGVAGGKFSADNVNTVHSYEIGGNSVLSVGSASVFLGVGAGAHNTGSDNTFAGSQAGAGNTTGTANTFSGEMAGFSNVGGSYNTFSGAKAGYSNTTGQKNTFSGLLAGSNNTTGLANTFYGESAGLNNTTGSSDVYIANPGPTAGTESNTIRIGTQGAGAGQQNAAYIAGIFGSTSSSGVPVFINSNGQLGTLTSSLRFKEQVQDMGDSTSALMKLRPVTFLYKPEYAKGDRTLQYGLIAEEVAQVYPELVAYDDDGKPYTVRYQYIATMLLNEVQKQYHRAEAEATVIQSLQQEIQDLKQQLQLQNVTLQERLSRLEKVMENQVQTVAQK